MKKKKYNIIYSLGADCSCALYMETAKLRSFSGPFDWLTHALFKTRMELILNDFDGFLEIEDLILLETDSNIINDNQFDYYCNLKTDFHFYHDFKAGEPLKNLFSEVKARYKRRVDRFYSTIQANQKVLLIWFSHYQRISDQVVLDLCSKICQKFNKNIDFLIIEHDAKLKMDDIIKIKIAPNITRYYLYTRSTDEKGNPTTQGRIDACLPIFKQYKLIIPIYKQIFISILKLSIKLTPIKQLYQILRKRFLL